MRDVVISISFFLAFLLLIMFAFGAAFHILFRQDQQYEVSARLTRRRGLPAPRRWLGRQQGPLPAAAHCRGHSWLARPLLPLTKLRAAPRAPGAGQAWSTGAPWPLGAAQEFSTLGRSLLTVFINQGSILDMEVMR